MESVRAAEAGFPTVARTPDGDFVGVTFLFGPQHRESLERVSPGLYPRAWPDQWWTENSYILPAYRGRRVIPSLLQRSAGRIPSLGGRMGRAIVSTANVPSLRGCRRAGFRPDGLMRVDRLRFGRRSYTFLPASQEIRRRWEEATAPRPEGGR
jgi:RimJ/RimL family protein N-acetyltransferase